MVSASKSSIRSAVRILLANLVFSLLDGKGTPDRFKLALLNLSQSSRSLATKFRKVRLGQTGYPSFQAFENVQGESLVVFGSSLRRLYQLYMFGIRQRWTRLGESYFLQEIEFQPGDVVVDVGANLGDLFGFISSQVPDIRYIAFEPNPQDFRSLEQNIRKSEAFMLALGNLNSTLPFYVNTADGDSSLIMPKSISSKVIEVPVKRLDSLLDASFKIKLLKLEAEGFEPEVLEGCSGLLDQIEYLALDGGPERGLTEETTIETLLNHLLSMGFILVKLDVVTGMGRALLKRRIAT